MNEIDFMRALTEIDDEFLLEAELPPKKKSHISFQKINSFHTIYPSFSRYFFSFLRVRSKMFATRVWEQPSSSASSSMLAPYQ